MQAMEGLLELFVALSVLDDRHRTCGWLKVLAQECDMVAVASRVNPHAKMQKRRCFLVGHPTLPVCDPGKRANHQCAAARLLRTSFGMGDPCDKRSGRIMYQLLKAKVGGRNLLKEVQASGTGDRSSRLHTPPVCHDRSGLGVLAGIDHTRDTPLSRATGGNGHLPCARRLATMNRSQSLLLPRSDPNPPRLQRDLENTSKIQRNLCPGQPGLSEESRR